MTLTIHGSIDEIDAVDWDALAGNRYPFMRHAFLSAAESSASVCTATGWTPRHLTLTDHGKLIAALLLYEKSHSWGEFVFDWSWAQAYQRHGLDYYPKLVSAAPFTPAPCSRLLTAKPNDREATTRLVRSAMQLARDSHCSSLHILFPHTGEVTELRRLGMHIRKDCQFHWHNEGYADFDSFLQTFSSAKRKKVRRDRRHVLESGICLERLHGSELSNATWQRVYDLISTTFMRRGSLPYFNLDFFLKLSHQMPDKLMVVVARQGTDIIAAALFYVGDEALYGRYWGSVGDHDALHFETCYYQGIEYCIEHGLRLFEPGTQGEHKISRGFIPVETWSAHWFAHPGFQSAIGDYLVDESEHIDQYIHAVELHSPYRSKVSNNGVATDDPSQ